MNESQPKPDIRGLSINSMPYARYGARSVPIIVDAYLIPQTAILTANGELHVGPNTDLEVLFFHMNMTPRDKRLLAAMKIGL